MHTRALCTVLLISALLVSIVPFGGGQRVLAQESVAPGTAVPVTDDAGTPVGSITVTEVADPFTEFDPAYPAEAGSRYIALTVAFDSDAGARFDIAPYAIVLQDDQGFLHNPSSLFLTDEALIPELSSQTLAPGSRVTGLIGFVLPEGSAPARVFFQPESSRLVPLATLLAQEAPAIGEPAEITDSEGGTGSVTVTGVVDPFEDFDPGQVPPEGARFVLVTLTYENTSDGRFFIEPYRLTLRDSDGYLWSSTFVSRPDEVSLVPDLASAQLAPGDRLSGAVTFAVPTEAALDVLYDSPVSGQLLVLAGLQGAESIVPTEPSEEATPAAETEVSDEAAVESDDTATAADTSGSDSNATTEACANVEQWLAAARARIEQAGAMSVEDATLTDLEGLAAHAAEYRSLAEAQLAETAPPEGAGVNKALAATLNAYAAAVEQVLGATEPGKDTVLELTEGMNTFNDAGTRLHQIEQELNRIAAECGL